MRTARAGSPATLMNDQMSSGLASASTRLKLRVRVALLGDRERGADLHRVGARGQRRARRAAAS